MDGKLFKIPGGATIDPKDFEGLPVKLEDGTVIGRVTNVRIEGDFVMGGIESLLKEGSK